MVVLKRLSDALLAGDPIHGVVRSSAAGQNGRSNNITSPNTCAQQSLIRSAYKAVGVKPQETVYVEAHGTGTSAGDIAEMEALQQCFCQGRVKPLLVGSIKANVGHLESTSGLAGLLKVLLVLKRGQIPAMPGFQSLKSKLRSHSTFIEVGPVSRGRKCR